MLLLSIPGGPVHVLAENKDNNVQQKTEEGGGGIFTPLQK